MFINIDWYIIAIPINKSIIGFLIAEGLHHYVLNVHDFVMVISGTFLMEELVQRLEMGSLNM